MQVSKVRTSTPLAGAGMLMGGLPACIAHGHSFLCTAFRAFVTDVSLVFTL